MNNDFQAQSSMMLPRHFHGLFKQSDQVNFCKGLPVDSENWQKIPPVTQAMMHCSLVRMQQTCMYPPTCHLDPSITGHVSYPTGSAITTTRLRLCSSLDAILDEQQPCL